MYKEIEDLIRDMNTMFKNCLDYNGPGIYLYIYIYIFI